MGHKARRPALRMPANSLLSPGGPGGVQGEGLTGVELQGLVRPVVAGAWSVETEALPGEDNGAADGQQKTE